ncbi:transcription activator of gluconeogenesis [Apodospora peruviana]|uniref:Transcription activator of gluconeogenesis n=1 Tax=Apodospora peruviana TaxID=516989 RepID=A0AAE0M1T7_9PEZI|nr:transcription activator of gluconeogenesis [Apodospora peruviana]
MLEDAGPPEAEVSGVMSDSDNEYDELETQNKDEDDKMAEQTRSSEGVDANGDPKKKYDPKDPSRPRRKKARRACYACQRAHLTCGDERPCQRCIKRGLADACQDGVRKKAKYLHDAPPEALRPVLGPNYTPSAASTRTNGHRHPSNSGSEASPTVSTYFSQPNSQYPVFSSTQPPMATMPENMPFGSQHSPVSPSFQTMGNPQMGGMAVPQVSSPMANFTSTLFDPSNPAIFNFNLEGLTFGSQYGAMEFGMLGQMASGAAETPPRDASMSQQGAGDPNFGSSGVFGNGIGHYDKVYEGGVIGDFLGLDANANGQYSQGNLQHGLPHAYAIPVGPTSLQSPSTENNSPQPSTFPFEGSPTTATYSTTPGPGTSQSMPPSRPKPKTPALAKIGPQSILGKRQRDPSYIYETVKEPFPYVSSFHKIIALLKDRFSPQKTTHIAKSLASIRQPFMSCTRTLTRQDFVFMEKSFQRALFEYEEFMHQCSSPALACRRTGEVAGVNKEFTALTGWTKDVLLGKEPNLNVNIGSSNSSSSSNSVRARTTPQLKSLNNTTMTTTDATTGTTTTSEDQPVFLAELLDDDSVIEFYEDYAQLAFNDSRGKVVRKARLLKYRTQQNSGGGGGGSGVEGEDNNNSSPQQPQQQPQKDPRHSILSNRVAKIDGEHGISKLEKDGKLECSYTWTIKRDTFDIPMIIIINVSDFILTDF